MLFKRAGISRAAFCFVLCVVVFIGELLAANDAPSLAGLSLFMSKAERDSIDKVSPPTAAPVETVVPVVIDKPAPKRPVIRKVTLHGAVIRPDQSAVLLLNTGTKILQRNEHSSAPDLHFKVQAYRNSVKLVPGETVRVRVRDGL